VPTLIIIWKGIGNIEGTSNIPNIWWYICMNSYRLFLSEYLTRIKDMLSIGSI